MKKISFSLISSFLGIVLFFWLFNRVEWQMVKNIFLRLSVIEGIFLLVLTALGMLLGTLRWKEILKSKGYHFSLKELYGHYLAASAITYLTPMFVFGGEIFRGYVFNAKGENPTSLEKAMAASFTDTIFECIFGCAAICLGAILFFFTAGFTLGDSQTMVLTISLLLAGGIFCFFIFKKKSIIKIFLKVDEQNRGRRVEKEILSFFKIKNRSFQKVFLISFFKTSVRFFQYWLLVDFLGKSISLLTAISVLGFSILFMGVPISADFGSHDLGSAVLFGKLGLGLEVGAVFASIVRGINLILAIIGLLFLSKFGIEFLQNNLLKKIKRLFQK